VAAVCVVLALALVLFVHAPPVRRAALDRVITLVAERFDVALRADALAYNLLALRLTLTGLEVAATRTPQNPFLTADRLDVAIPISALFGALSIDYVGLQNARLRIERGADGRSNLPESGAEPGEPQAVPIGRLDIPRLAVAVIDRARDASLTLPAVAADIGPDEGSIRLLQPAEATRGAVAVAISALGGGVVFDGRSVGLTAFGVTTPQARLQMDGSIALLVDEPRADLRFSGRGDVARVLGLIADAPPVSGMVGVEGTLNGPLTSPDTRLRLRSEALEWDRLVVSNVDAAIDVDERGVHLSRLSSGVAGGRATAAGDLATEAGAVDLELAWDNVDVDALLRALAVSGVRPAARGNGTATVRGAGSDFTAWTVGARMRLIPTRRARGQIAVAGDAAFHAGGGRWTLDFDGVVEQAPVRAMLGGRLDRRSFAASTVSGEVSAASVDLTAVLASLRDAGLVETDATALTAGRVDATAKLAGTLSTPRIGLTAAARDLAAGGLSGVMAEVTAAGTLRDLAVDARMRQGSGNDIVATGTVSPDVRSADLRVTGTIRDWSALQGDVPVRGAAALDLRVQGPFDAMVAQGTVTVADAGYSSIDIGRLLATIDANGDAVVVDVTSPELAAHVTGTLSLSGNRRGAIELQIDEADLERLVRDAGAPLPIAGRVSLMARADVPLDDWRRGRAELDVTRLEGRAGNLPIRLSTPARAIYDGGLIDVASLEAQVGETRLSVAGRIATESSATAVAPADALRALLVGDIDGVLAAVAATGLATVPAVTARGPVALLARVTGPVERPSLAADLDVGMAEIAFGEVPPIRIGEFRASIADGWIERLGASAEWQGSQMTAAGRIPLHLFREHLPAAIADALPVVSGPASLDVTAQSITPAVLTPFVDAEVLAQIDGVIDASARLEADALDAAALRGDVRLDRLDVRVAGLPVTQREPTRVEIGNGIARVASWQWAGQGATLNVQGEIGLTNQQAALLAAGVIDLRLLSPFLRTAGMTISGSLAPRFSVSGSLANPRLDGEAAVTGAEIRLAEPRLIATSVDAFAVLSPDSARMTSLAGVVNGGTLTGSGEAHYGPGVSPSARLDATMTGIGLEFPEGLRSELNADLSLAVARQGEQTSGAVTGTVTVVRSAYREPLAVAAGLLTALRTEQAAVAPAEPDAFASRLALDVRLVTDSDVIVDNNLARVQLGGDLRIIGTAAAPALSGRSVVREGGQLFLGRNVYTIESGTIDFTDPDAIVPDLNVLARTRAGGHDIELTVSGMPDDLELTTASPTLDSEADRASVLLTGRVLDAVSGAEADIVREQIVSYLSGDVLALAGRAIGLDTVRLGGPDTSTLRRDPAAVAGETDPTSRLTFGKLIGDDIELTYSQSLRDGAAQTWIVDYRPIDQLNLRLVSDDENLRAYEFRHDVSIGGSRSARPSPPSRPARSERVVQVIVASDGTVPESSLREALRLEEGDAFDFADWQRDRDRLEAFLRDQGRLEARVVADRQAGDGGVTLVYNVAAGPLTDITVTGYTLDSAGRMAIEEAWTQSIFDDFLREEADAILRAALADEGFLEPRISSTVVSGETKTLQIAVEPGRRTRTRRVAVTASGDDVAADEIESWLQERGLASGWDQPEDLRTALIDELRTRGYIAAEVRTEAPRIEGGIAVLPVIVDAGAVFRIGEVTFPGASRIVRERLQAEASLSAGDPYTAAAADAARQRLDAAYRSEGFFRARVTLTPGVDRERQRVAVVFTIEEGPQQVLREVSVVGNRGIDTDVIMRALDIGVGEPVGADAWLQARARLFDTGLFRRVDVTVEPLDPGADAAQSPARLRVVVEEWPAVRFRYGLQVSEERPEDSLEGRDLTPGLSADVTRRTLFGRAVGVGLAAQYQRRERLARVFLNAPTFFGLPVGSLFSAERSHREFTDQSFVTDIESLAWEQRVRPGTAWQFGYAYRFDRDHTFNTGVPDNPFAPVFDVTVNVARLTGSAVFDTRDDPTETTRGWLLSSNLELSPTSLGSDVSFVRQLGQAYHFRSVGPVVLASAGRLGFVSPRGGQAVLPSELFQAGGARTVRGVAENELGPRDFFGPSGGQAVVVMNQEVRFPIFRWVRGVGFFDAGNVFAEPRDIDFRRLVTAYGAGLRVATPFALLRIDYGRPWTNAGDVRRVEWTFGIGHTF
jgi:outer membrane protein assembly factor BamA/autotransporter translocation and assembly factor TamB